MITKKEALITALNSICNPFHLAISLDVYMMSLKTVRSMLDDFKTETYIIDDTLGIVQAEIDACIMCVERKSETITYYWNKIKELIPCVETVITCDIDGTTWDKWTYAHETAVKILDRDN